MKLLVTRADIEAGTMARELASLGHEPVLQPLLALHYLDCDWTALSNAHGLVATSRNGLRALVQSGHITDVMLRLPLFAVGEGTERLARQLGFRDIKTGQGTGESLFETISGGWPKNLRLLHLSGEHQAYPLGAKLRETGFTVDVLICYSMAARDRFDADVVELFRQRQIGGVLLMSPRTADIYLHLCERHGLLEDVKDVAIYCLSQPIALRVTRQIRPPLRVASAPCKEKLLSLIANEADQVPPSVQHT